MAPHPAGAQFIRTNTLTVAVLPGGSILTTEPLRTGAREPTGDLHVLGGVTVRFIGSWQVQVRLTAPFVETTGNGKVKATNEVRVKLANGTWATVGTAAWVTVRTGTGTVSTAVPFDFLVVWGKSSAKSPATALAMPISYRVVPYP